MKKLALILLLVGLAIAKPAHAQLVNSVELSVSPPHSEILIKPGKNIVQAFNIQNSGTVDLIVIPILVDFIADPETGEQRILNTSSFPYAELQNLDKKLNEPFTLQAGQKDQLVVKFSIPEDAVDHDYYQTLLLTTKPVVQLDTNANTSTALAHVGINILIRISESGNDLGQLTVSRVVMPKIIDIFSPINMQIFVKNTGKNFTKIGGEVRVVSAITKNVEKVFPMLEENVLAESIRQAHAAAPDPDEAKSATAAEFQYDPLFLIGPYTVEIQLHAQNKDAQTFRGQVWALPISPLIVMILFLFTRIFLKRFNSRKEIPHLTS